MRMFSAVIWKMVLYFPRPDADMILPSALAMPLSAVMDISRDRTIITIHAGSLPRGTSIIMAPVTISLSARGSSSFPILLSTSHLRAR